jgi:ferrochelatase
MGYGGPASLDDVEPFLTSMMGRPPSPEMLESVKARYTAIGGRSPLPEIAAEMADALRLALAERGHEVAATIGMRHWRPYIADGLAELAEGGARRVVTVSLAPFESFASSGAYRAAVEEAAAGMPGLSAVEAPSFRTQPGFVDALMGGCGGALDALSASARGVRTAVLFTAHSLPVSELAEDPYVDELRETAAAVAERLGLAAAAMSGRQEWLPGIDAFGSAAAEKPWLLAYQSKGQRPGDWLGPDLADVIAALPGAGIGAVAFSPIGFSTDHLETLYDLDVVAAGQAAEAGLSCARAAVPNGRPAMIEALVAIVEPLLT